MKDPLHGALRCPTSQLDSINATLLHSISYGKDANESFLEGAYGSRGTRVHFSKSIDPPHFGVTFSFNDLDVCVNVATAVLALKLIVLEETQVVKIAFDGQPPTCTHCMMSVCHACFA